MTCKINQIFSSKRRAISDIIVTMLLITGTVIMGAIIFSFFSGSDSPTAIVEQTIETQPGTTPRDIIIAGYDTRDGINIGSTDLDNSNSDTDDALKSGEYISITIRDRGQGSINLEKISINEIEHVWEPTDCTLATDGALSGCTSAFENGEFIIIDGNNPSSSVTTNVSQLIQEGLDKRIVVKLSDDFSTSDTWIELNKSIRIAIVVANFEPTEFIIAAGGTR